MGDMWAPGQFREHKIEAVFGGLSNPKTCVHVTSQSHVILKSQNVHAQHPGSRARSMCHRDCMSC